MIRLTITVQKKGVVTPVSFKRAVSAAIARIASEWAATMLPKHFQQGVQSQYSYRPRTSKYLKRKARMAQQGIVQDGGKTDLVFTGKLRDAARNYVAIKTKGLTTHASFYAPNYVRFRGMMYETNRLTPGEESYLNHLAEKTLNAILQKGS